MEKQIAPAHLFMNLSPPHVWCWNSATRRRFVAVLHGAVPVWRTSDSTGNLVQGNLRKGPSPGVLASAARSATAANRHFASNCSRPAENRTATVALQPLFTLYTRCTSPLGSRQCEERRLAFCNSPTPLYGRWRQGLNGPAPLDRAPDIGRGWARQTLLIELAVSFARKQHANLSGAGPRACPSASRPSGPCSPPSGFRVAGATTPEVAPIV